MTVRMAPPPPAATRRVDTVASLVAWAAGYVSHGDRVEFTAPCACGRDVTWTATRINWASAAVPGDHECEEGL